MYTFVAYTTAQKQGGVISVVAVCHALYDIQGRIRFWF